MNIGRFEIESLSEGIFEVFEDGSLHKVQAEQITSPPPELIVPKKSALVGIDPILIRDGKHNILIDCGLGWGLDARSSYENTSNLKTNLDIFGLSPSDITHVVLSHLHFDHAGGASFVDTNAETQPTLPFANYFVQKKEWHYALECVHSENSTPGAGYELDEFYKLIALDKIALLTDAQFELIPGVTLIRTGGHTPGHQIVKIQDGDDVGYYLGDLVPAEDHLNQYTMRQLDADPLEAKKAKTLILRQAYRENACLLFYHSIHAKAGRLSLDVDRRYVLEEIS
ncbi:MAG: MBL fold metallo-hydrolase [Bacteroidota bacterium]